MICQRHLLIAFLVVCSLWSISLAEEQPASDTTTEKNSIKLPGGGDVSLPANMLQLVTAAGALVLGFVGVAIIISLVLPLFGIRLCHLIGTCDHYVGTTPYTGHQYDTYGTGTTGTYNQPLYGTTQFQKRSLEYMGPILKTLNAAYDKYAVPLLKKKD